MDQSASSQTDPPLSNQETDPAIEAYLNSGYDKHIKRARNTLFILAGIQFLGGIFTSSQVDSTMQAAVWTEVLIISGIFFALAFWSKKKPYAALLTAIIFYLSYQVLIIVLNPGAIFQGIILKAIVVVYLFLGLSNAKSDS